MSVHQQPELKAAILGLPDKEKDKLLIRLINKDKMLIKRLHFQLLEDEADLSDRIDDLRERLVQLFELSTKSIRNQAHQSNIIALTKLIRQANGMVNEHEKITKHKLSEIEFRILILQQSFEHFSAVISREDLAASRKLHQYIAGRVKYIIGHANKLHEDLRFDYQDDIQKLLQASYETSIGNYLKQLKISKNWW